MLDRRFNAIVFAAALAMPQLGYAQTPTQTSALSAAAAVSESPTLNAIAERGTVRLGVRPDVLPFSYQLPDGSYVGYSIDLCMRVVDALRVHLKQPKLRAVQVPSKSLNHMFEQFKKNEVDLYCAAIVNTPERRKQVAFSLPHLYSIARVLIWSDTDVKSVFELNGKTIAGVKGNWATQQLNEMVKLNLAQFRVQEVESPDAATKLLSDRQVAAYASGEVGLHVWRAQQKNPSAYKVIGETLAMESVALVLPKDDPAFKKRVDIAVSHAMVDGHVGKSYKRWFLEPIPPNNIRLDMPMSEPLRSQLLYPTDQAAGK